MTVTKTYEDKNGFAYMDRQQTENNGFDAFCPAPETSVTENNLMEETVLRFWETWTKQLILYENSQAHSTFLNALCKLTPCVPSEYGVLDVSL